MSTSASLSYTYPMPIGCVIPYFGKKAPDTFLLCDGGEYDIADYPDLHKVLGGIYGETADTFFVPDCVNRFIQATLLNQNDTVAGSGTINSTFTLAESNMPSLPVTGSITSISAVADRNDILITSGADHKGTAGSSIDDAYLPNLGEATHPNYIVNLNGITATYTGGSVPQTITSNIGVEPANYSVLYIIKATP